MTKAQFQDLPEAIINEIFLNVNFVERAQASPTSTLVNKVLYEKRYWQQLIRKYFKYLERVNSSLFQSNPKKQFSDELMRRTSLDENLYDPTKSKILRNIEQWLEVLAGNPEVINKSSFYDFEEGIENSFDPLKERTLFTLARNASLC